MAPILYSHRHHAKPTEAIRKSLIRRLISKLSILRRRPSFCSITFACSLIMILHYI